LNRYLPSASIAASSTVTVLPPCCPSKKRIRAEAGSYYRGTVRVGVSSAGTVSAPARAGDPTEYRYRVKGSDHG
jgi:hypothetical protein